MMWAWMTIAMATTVDERNLDNAIGVWSEFGCTKDQIIIKHNGKMTVKLWAGDEYGWLQEYRFWSIDGNVLTTRERRSKHSQMIEEWTITELNETVLQMNRTSMGDATKENDEQRTVQLNRCP